MLPESDGAIEVTFHERDPCKVAEGASGVGGVACPLEAVACLLPPAAGEFVFARAVDKRSGGRQRMRAIRVVRAARRRQRGFEPGAAFCEVTANHPEEPQRSHEPQHGAAVAGLLRPPERGAIVVVVLPIEARISASRSPEPAIVSLACSAVFRK